MEIILGSHVQVISGEYQGYYGVVVEIGEDVVRVAHTPGYYGFWIHVNELELWSK